MFSLWKLSRYIWSGALERLSFCWRSYEVKSQQRRVKKWRENQQVGCPYTPFSTHCCLSSRSVCLCWCALIHINYLGGWKWGFFSLSSLQRFPNKCRGAFTSGRLSLSATTEASEKHGNPELHKKHILLASANEVISTQQLSCQQLCRVFAAQTSWGSKNKPWAEFLKTRTIKKKWRHRRCESETQRALDELPVSVCHRYKVSPTPATEEVSHSYSPAVCRLQTRGAVEWQACGRDQISFWNFNLLQLNYLISEPPTSKGIPQLPPSCLPWWSFSIQLPESLTRLISAPCGLKAEIGDVQH